MLRRAALLLCVLAAMAFAAAPALAGPSGGAAVPSTVSNSDGSSTQPSGGAAANDPRAEQAARARAKRRRAKRQRERARARRRAAERKRRHAQTDGYVFPVDGPHSFGGPDSRFGAPRNGHRHEGQDVTAAEGTPLVSPHAGTVRFVDYQAGGAGYYVVIHDSAGKYEFALMHIKKGTITVHPGQSVRAGQRIGRVGHTGVATGPHLHFEVWVGPWQTGGHPIDPLPLLRRWDK